MARRWTVQLVTFLWGISLPDWWRLLRQNRFRIHPRYLFRAWLITVASCFHWLLSGRDRRVMRSRTTATTAPAHDPVFILGHWGSGTTLLHTLLTRAGPAGEGLAYPTLLDVANPHIMLTCEPLLRRCFGRFTPQHRVWDAVAVDLQMPAEDELAVSLLSGVSPYLAWCFPNREAHYDRFLTFDQATSDELDRWKQAMLVWVQKLSVKYPDRRLVLKSPPHTAKIRLLLELFPDARFVHLHRNPFDVFQATRRLYERALPYFCLQRLPPPDDVAAGILDRYAVMYQAYFAQRQLIPDGHFCEVSYETLVEQPVEEVESIYTSLGLPNSADRGTALCDYLATIAGYQTNRNAPLPSALQQSIQQKWACCFSEWGYATTARAD